MDSLKLVNTNLLKDEMPGGRQVGGAWSDDQIFLDPSCTYEKIFDTRPTGSVANSDLNRPDEDGVFLLLPGEHIEQIIAKLTDNAVTTPDQIETLKEWQKLSLSTDRYQVAYLFHDEAQQSNEQWEDGTDENYDHALTEPDRSNAAQNTGRLAELQVRTSKFQLIIVILLSLFVLPFSLMLVISNISRGPDLRPIELLIGILPFFMFGIVLWRSVGAHLRSVRSLSADGVQTNSGARYDWSGLDKIIDRVRSRGLDRKHIWRTELHFANGKSAWLLPSRVKNLDEVYDYLSKMRLERTEEMD